MYWVQATVRDFTIKSRGIVKSGSTADQRKLFFNLAAVRRDIERKAYSNRESLTQVELHARIADRLSVSVADVDRMAAYIASDASLDARVSSEDADGATWADMLPDNAPIGADRAIDHVSLEHVRSELAAALMTLKERERDIVMSRKMSDAAMTLEELAARYGVSRERVRQIEEVALGKLRKKLSASLLIDATPVH